MWSPKYVNFALKSTVPNFSLTKEKERWQRHGPWCYCCSFLLVAAQPSAQNRSHRWKQWRLCEGGFTVIWLAGTSAALLYVCLYYSRGLYRVINLEGILWTLNTCRHAPRGRIDIIQILYINTSEITLDSYYMPCESNSIHLYVVAYHHQVLPANRLVFPRHWQ